MSPHILFVPNLLCRFRLLQKVSYETTTAREEEKRGENDQNSSNQRQENRSIIKIYWLPGIQSTIRPAIEH